MTSRAAQTFCLKGLQGLRKHPEGPRPLSFPKKLRWVYKNAVRKDSSELAYVLKPPNSTNT